MATALLSQHSSNPLEVGSSDARNSLYIQRYLEAEGRKGGSSDDHLNGHAIPTYAQSRNHSVHHVPNTANTRPNSTSLKRTFTALDEDMESEDELIVVRQPVEDREMDGDTDEGEVDSDAEGETDEENTIYLKSPEERQEVEEEINDLEQTVPMLSEDYKIVDRLGTGTFSSVYKAIDLGYHEKWDNTPWHGQHPPNSSAYYQSMPRPRDSKVFVAIKRIYVTSNPERIRNEIAIMEDCRGCRHTSQLITAFRHFDQVVAVMPYHRNVDFREFYRNISLQGIKAYFRCMFRALRDIHERVIIHRDVKPANFLFDPQTGIGTLCDFGLASRMDLGPTQSHCLHTKASRQYPHGRTKHRSEFDGEEVKRVQKDARSKSGMPSERVGYPDKDPRPISKANRAGTRGFRAPEVLFKCGDQTGAIDVWAAGMILLFFLTGKFPLFQSNDDIEALMEIAAIIGRRKMERTATLHSRTFATNVPSISSDGITWRQFVEKQNPSLFQPRPPDSRFWPYNQPLYGRSKDPQTLSTAAPLPPPSPTPYDRYSPPTNNQLAPMSEAAHRGEIEKALDLLEVLMHPESVKRITPRDALAHKFLQEPDDREEDDAPVDDDDFVPHPFGRGVCSDLHFREEITEVPYVRTGARCECGECDGATKYEEVRRLMAGEGLAIGSQPCEFHRGEFGF